MDLMLEQMQEQPVSTFQLHPCTAMDLNDLVDAGLIKRFAPGD